MLVARGISVERAGRMLLDKVSLTVRPAEVVAVVGPNGAGKSTLLKVLSGDLRPDRGTVALDDLNLDQYSPKSLARKRAVLPQESALNFPFTAEEIVQMGRSPHIGAVGADVHAQTVDDTIEAVQVGHLRRRDFTTLSGGERQRVHLARVLAQIWELQPAGARYLLLDEPTSALDLAHQHQVLAAAKRLAVDQHIGVLAIVRDLNLAALYAHQIAMLSQGRLVRVGEAGAVLSAEAINEVFGISAEVIQRPDLKVPHVLALPV